VGFVTEAACLYDLPAVGRRRLVVPVLFALSGLGWAAAHAMAHRAVMSDPDMPPGMADQYLGYMATSLALCFALALPLAAGALIGKRWRGASLQSLWLFGLVPVLGFVGHAVGEPLIAGAPASLSSVLPVALVGLLAQIPFALVAVSLACHVLSLAERLARVVAATGGARVRVSTPSYPAPRGNNATAFRLDLAYAERGPPLLAA
jgi:hypothetical protein